MFLLISDASPPVSMAVVDDPLPVQFPRFIEMFHGADCIPFAFGAHDDVIHIHLSYLKMLLETRLGLIITELCNGKFDSLRPAQTTKIESSSVV